MAEKSKKKKLKQKQKQRQKQKQSVIVNVNLAKSREKSSSGPNPQNSRVQLPPPVHKVYASPIHNLVPSIFDKEGRQTAQLSLSEQIEKLLDKREQSKPTNVLGEGQPPPRKFNRPLRITSEFADPPFFETLSENESVPVSVRRRLGRRPGSKNKPRIRATEVLNSPDVMGVAEVVEEPEYSEKKQIPDEFIREQFLLRPPQDRYGSPPETLFDTPRPPDQPLGADITTKKNQKKV